MTSKVATNAAREPKAQSQADLASKDDSKPSGTAGNEDPTNCSTAGSLNPSTKKEKASSSPAQGAKQDQSSS